MQSGLLRCLTLLCLLIGFPAMAASDYETAKAAYLARAYPQALQLLQPLAENGDVRAQATLALIYDHGQGIDRDRQQALYWYTQAASAGLAQAQYDLGTKYYRGDGVAHAPDKAITWWRQAAHSGMPEAQYNLALAYDRGVGVDSNPEQALHWYLQAARQGYGLGQYALGVLYASGRGTRRDLQQAQSWFEAAAAHDIAAAQYNLGILYELGRGTSQDVGLAIKWYRRAAGLGLPEASSRLAEYGLTPRPRAVTPIPVTTPSTPAHMRKPAVIHRLPWILHQPADAYTVQLASGLDEAAIRELLEGLSALGETAYFEHTRGDGTIRYIALLGVFPSHAEATQALQQLPAPLQKAHPWVRRYGKLQLGLKFAGQAN